MPNNLGNLVNLRTLIIGLKLVKLVPEPVLALTGLQALSIAFCKLTRMPPGLAAMTNLRELNLQGNSGLIVRSLSIHLQQSLCHGLQTSPRLLLELASVIVFSVRLPMPPLRMLHVSLSCGGPAMLHAGKVSGGPCQVGSLPSGLRV